MRLRIHRGASEIGGNCVELQSERNSILLDLGLPLEATAASPSYLPALPGLTDGSNPDLLGVVLSHPHGDHYGLAGLIDPTIPVFIGLGARKLLNASSHFMQLSVQPMAFRTYTDGVPFELGPFKVTPFLTDHSAFDAYCLLIEANGRRVFYSGDLRAHGRKARLVENLLQHPPINIDVLILEGTTLSREDTNRANTEAELENDIRTTLSAAPGLVLVCFSPQNIDRFVTVFRATQRAGRKFIADIYLAHVLDELDLPSLPKAGSGAIRVYLPSRQRQKIVAEKTFSLVDRYRNARIFKEEISQEPRRWVMLFRESMMPDIERLGLAGSTLIYSLWPGYLPKSSLREWSAERNIEFHIRHTSGHADRETLIRLAQALQPRVVVPIHTQTPRTMQQIIPNVRLTQDGEWLDV